MRGTAAELTCSRWKVEDEYCQNTSEDAGNDDVDDVEERLPLDDEVEGDVFVQLLLDVLPAGFVTNGPLSILCEGCVINSTGIKQPYVKTGQRFIRSLFMSVVEECITATHQ